MCSGVVAWWRQRQNRPPTTVALRQPRLFSLWIPGNRESVATLASVLSRVIGSGVDRRV
jgi:hypothetical protein